MKSMAFDLDNLTKAVGALGSLVGLAGKAGTVEYNRNVIELQQALIATQRDMQTLIDENAQLRNELSGLQSRTFHHSVEWKMNVDGQEEGPFCPVCRADSGKEMPLKLMGPHISNAELIIFACPKDHTGGKGRDTVYLIPKPLLKADRYGPRL